MSASDFPLFSGFAMSKHLVRRLMVLGENRVELLFVELQEERDRCLQALALALAMAVLFLLGGIVFSAAVVLVCWNLGPLIALGILFIFYIAGGILAWWRLSHSLKGWDTLAGTRQQFRKDREQFERFIQ
ncbi:MAG TPA: phage holin family protein [Candidatus Limnocylindria bacterium]|jgi:uncharacterized membrane protein YqjE|nr:phage holin family protein [Candidatus Limnocylindria bacterium]